MPCYIETELPLHEEGGACGDGAPRFDTVMRVHCAMTYCCFCVIVGNDSSMAKTHVMAPRGAIS